MADTPTAVYTIFTHHTLKGWVVECTCEWASPPVAKGGREAARTLGDKHLREAHP